MNISTSEEINNNIDVIDNIDNIGDKMYTSMQTIYNTLYPIPNYIGALFKVIVDRSKEAISQNQPQESTNADSNIDNKNSHDELKEFIDVSQYQNEKTHDRIYPLNDKYNEITTFLKKPTHIIDNIYIGSAFNAASYYTLQEHNIGMIVNVTSEISNYYPNEYKYHNVSIHDNNKESLEPHLDEIYDVITNYQTSTPDKNILIHCFMGASRSVSVVTDYLMRKDPTLTFASALNFLKNYRKNANPTFRFAKDIAKKNHNISPNPNPSPSQDTNTIV